MREYTYPGVFVEEVPSRIHSIDGVDTSTAAFVGPTLLAPDLPLREPLKSFAEFELQFGGPGDLVADSSSSTNYVAYAARAFFENGGTRLYVVRVETGATAADYMAALESLYELADVAVVAAPGSSARTDAAEIRQALVDHVERAPEHSRYHFAVLDSPPLTAAADVRSARANINSSRVALYHPWVTVDNVNVPPSGFVCGIFARVDTTRGVWKAPANETLTGASGLAVTVNEAEQQTLNAAGINCIRTLPGRGILLWGARTATADNEWKYVNVRRYALYLERSLSEGLQWVVFEPNGEALWATVRTAVTDFLFNNWRSGALLGSKPEEAFFVHCDRATMTQNDIDNGRLIVEVGFAPLKPAEFVIIRIGLWTASHSCD